MMALNAFKTTKLGFSMKIWTTNMFIFPVFLELRKNLFLADDHGVPEDGVLLQPKDDIYNALRRRKYVAKSEIGLNRFVFIISSAFFFV